MVFKRGEKLLVADDGHFNDLCDAAGNVPLRQSGKKRGIVNVEHSGIKRPHDALPRSDIDSVLYPHCNIDEPDQRRRHAHVVDATAENRRRKTRNVERHASTNAEHDSISWKLSIYSGVADPLNCTTHYRCFGS